MTSNSCQVGGGRRHILFVFVQCVLLGLSYRTLCPILLTFCSYAPAFYCIFLGVPRHPLAPHGNYIVKNGQYTYLMVLV
jgi:hypothetical protein